MTNEKRLYQFWLEKTAGDDAAQKDLAAIADNEKEISDRFYRDLAFGTAGLRGIMGMGLNRMNNYTVGRATIGLAEYLKGQGIEKPSVAIAYDSRLCSEQFARHAAGVLAGAGVCAHIFGELMPTPVLSYAVRKLGCDAGINITASHNPFEYNGFKAYDSSGCQIGSDVADAVQKAISRTDIFDGVRAMSFENAVDSGMVKIIPESFVEQYLDCVFEQALQPEICAGADLKVVFTPLNGAGNKCVRAIFERLGIKGVHIVPEQENPDGNFPTCPYPNPETREALELGLALAKQKDSDLLIATDPDADRLGVAVKDGDGYRVLTGNEVGLLLLSYICSTRNKIGKMPPEPVAVRSVVSTRMADILAAHYGVEMHVVLTGFKFIGEIIAGLERDGKAENFIFGFEESCGYLSGGYVRDKDAINAALLVAELACECKTAGKTLIGLLDEMYAKFGVWISVVDNLMFQGESGMEQMSGIMESLRSTPPKDIAGDSVSEMRDYGLGVIVSGGVRKQANLPKTEMIELCLGENSVIVRPSGTEPKLKIYYTITGQGQGETQQKTADYRMACSKLVEVAKG